MVQEFIYTSSKGTNQRKILVFKEDHNYIEGIDLKVLDPTLAASLEKQFKDYKPTTESVKIEGWDPIWNVAWRKFSKSKMDEL